MEENSKDYRKLVIVICLASGLVPFMGSALNLAIPGSPAKVGGVVLLSK